jgi:anti-sigma factor RsiW
MSDSPILEADLHLYVDNNCNAELRARVEGYLALHPEAAERVASWRAQNSALQQIFALPPAKLPDHTVSASPRHAKSTQLLQNLTFLLVFLLGITLTIIVIACISILKTDMPSLQTLIHSIFFRG